MKRLYFYSKILIVLLSMICCYNGLLHAEIEVYQADAVPWSGYWWPFRTGSIGTGVDYWGSPSPLQKYELLTRGRENGPSVSWYKERYYDPEAPNWYGLCGFWAQAACYEDIQFYPSSENNIIFRVGDKKGLITLLHDNNIVEIADGRLPENFHFWLLEYIKDQGKSFVADLDPGDEVWSYPIYRYAMDKTVFPDRESYTVTISFADDFVHPDYMGTKIVNKTYTYDLFLDGNGVITSGQWTGESVNDHPKRLTFPILANSSFESLEYSRILEIANAKDDFLEEKGQVVPIDPGTYNLVLLDDDEYLINCLPEEKVKLEIEKQEGSSLNFTAVVTDAVGELITYSLVSEDTPLSLNFTNMSPPYSVTIRQYDYSDPNIYTLRLDIDKNYQQKIPYIPKNGMWSGFVITNPEETMTDNVFLTAYRANGEPIQTIFGSKQFLPGEKDVFLFENLDWRMHEYLDIDNVLLMASAPVGYLNMIGSDDADAASCFVQGNARGSHLVFPVTTSPFLSEFSMLGGVSNETLEEMELTLNVYSQSGRHIQQVHANLGPRESYEINPGRPPFYNMPDDGWIEVINQGGQTMSGYEYLSGKDFAESMFAIPITSSSQIIPHVPPAAGLWEATATIINPNDEYNTVRIHPSKALSNENYDMIVSLKPFEKITIELLNSFGYREGDPLYHSILEVTSDAPIVGYYTYSLLNHQEEAKYPFFRNEDCSSEMVLNHNAGEKGFWWTAACLFNSALDPVTLQIEPFDDNGNLLQNKVKQLQLAGGGYEVLLMKKLFGIPDVAEISFVKFRVLEPQGRIGGFSMYGAVNSNMLSGANM